VSAEIVTLDDGEMWVIEGKPGAYRAHPVGPPVGDSWEHKYELRAAIRHGDNVRRMPFRQDSDWIVTPPVESGVTDSNRVFEEREADRRDAESHWP
jgi:hypothetical protein